MVLSLGILILNLLACGRKHCSPKNAYQKISHSSSKLCKNTLIRWQFTKFMVTFGKNFY